MPVVQVAGSLVMDIVAHARRHPRPGETVQGKDLAFHPGGKGANQAIAAARMGVESQMIGMTGEDRFGREIVDYLIDAQVDTSCVLRSPRTHTGTSLVVVDGSGENTIVMTPGANAEFSPHDLQIEHVEKYPANVVLAQLEIPSETIEALFVRKRSLDCITILNAAPAQHCTEAVFALSDVVVFNSIEAQHFTGLELDAGTVSADAAGRLRSWRKHEQQILIVTLGAKGVYALRDEQEYRLSAYPVRAVDTVGAGDCFTGVLAAELAAAAEFPVALAMANAAASLAVQRHGAAPSMPHRKDVEDLMRQHA